MKVKAFGIILKEYNYWHFLKVSYILIYIIAIVVFKIHIDLFIKIYLFIIYI